MVLLLCRWVVAGIFLFSGPSPKTPFSPHHHPFYVSVVEIEHNTKENTLDISCKIFTDDLENTLARISHGKIDLSDMHGQSANDSLIAAYVGSRLKIRVNGKPVTFRFVGREKESEATWSYFQVPGIVAVKKITVDCNLLYETFSSQINIIHAIANGSRQSIELTNPATHTEFTW